MQTTLVVIRNLSEDCFLSLLKKYRNQPKKRALLKAFRTLDVDTEDFDKIALDLGYQSTKGAFLTLKHRLLRDIVDFKKLELSNKLIKTENRIHTLRMILYSKDKGILVHEIKELKSLVNELEIVKGSYEIHFCDYLLNYDDPTKRKAAVKMMENVLYEESLFNQSEFEFYRVIFEYQDIFYSGGILDPPEARFQIIEKIKSAHDVLQLSVTEFFFLSAFLTFELRLGKSKQEILALQPQIERLQALYIQQNLNYRFPNCDFAIQCLFSKYYLASGNISAFVNSWPELSKEAPSIVGIKTYEDTLIYYFFHSLMYHLNANNLKGFIEEFDSLIPKNMTKTLSNRLIFYIFYLKGSAWFYMENFKKSESYLRKGRGHEKYLEPINMWIQIEHALLMLIIQIKNKDLIAYDYEVARFKKILKSSQIENSSIKDFLKFLELHKERTKPDFSDIMNQLTLFSYQTNLFFLLRK